MRLSWSRPPDRVMTDADRLRRSYTRLLWAYPGWYRRERGLEVVTTLLDDAVPGQRRPRWADTVALIRGGAKARLFPPRGIPAYFVSVMGAFFTALCVSSVAVLLSPYPGPPTPAQVTAVATIALGMPLREVPGPAVECDGDGCPEWDSRAAVVADDEPPMRSDNIMLNFNPPHPKVAALVRAAHDRLAAAGWQVEPVSTGDDGGEGFGASADGRHFYLYAAPRTRGDPVATDLVMVTLSKHASIATVLAVAAAFLGGLLAGWLAGVWASHHVRRRSPLRRRKVLSAAVPFLIISPLVVLYSFLMIMLDAADGISQDDVEAPLVFILFWWHITTSLTVIGVVSGLRAVAIAARPGSAHDAPARPVPAPV